MGKKTDKRFLLIVEGEKAEVEVFTHVLKKYEYMVGNNLPKLDFTGKSKALGLGVFTNNDADVYIVSSKPNRLSDILKYYDPQTDMLERALGFKTSDAFQGTFLVYDVDHNKDETLEKAYSHFRSEESGLLLIECPCLEVLGDDEFNPIPEREMERPSESYKPELNLYHHRVHHCGTIEYIKNNFERLALRFLIQNHYDFNSDNVMDHPGLVIGKINEMNTRINKEDSTLCIYRYYTTVVYVFLAYIKGLTKKIDNYEAVKNMLEGKKSSAKPSEEETSNEAEQS